MKVKFFFVGKTHEKYLQEGNQIYLDRLMHYIPVELIVIPSPGSLSSKDLVKKESEAILKKINTKDFVILLDEKGKEFSSLQLADLMNNLMVRGVATIIFIVGGAFGVSENINKRANLILSFSKFTLTHQMIRIFLLEQLYRSMTILRNESYHNP
jgi:23S rRNA (pseudouridine1915-N3)-methyltransferase